MKKRFQTRKGDELNLPVFFPDATRAVLRSLDSIDIANTKTPGLLVNTYHLYQEVGKRIIKEHGSVGKFMNWHGGIISDSGGFQVMTLAKSGKVKGSISDKGVTFRTHGKKTLFTPEKSIEYQSILDTDMLVVLDDFTPPKASRTEAQITVNRSLLWARRCKEKFENIYKGQKQKPYLLAVVQGGRYQDLREDCTRELVKIGFDGLGYGGWPIDSKGYFDYETAKTIANNSPENYLLYGLGIGKPEEIVNCVQLGYDIFDCVLPTRDARHGRLYVYTAKSINDVDVTKNVFYKYYTPQKEMNFRSPERISPACDCLLCANYTRSYLAHLFKIKDMSAMRLASIHNLRFYSILMEKLQESSS
ncbi:tRNA-ribosyltransferase family protein [Patescibacteria group bacterium]